MDPMNSKTDESTASPSIAPQTSSSRPVVVAATPRLFPAGHLVPFILVTVLFFLWGIPNNLNDVLIRHFMKSFEITRFQAGLVQSAFYLGYYLLAMPAAFRAYSIPLLAYLIIGIYSYWG